MQLVSMEKREIIITCLQQTKWIDEKCKIGNISYKLRYAKNERNKNEIGNIVDTIKECSGVGKKCMRGLYDKHDYEEELI